jgi:hypothetical protein
MILPNVRESFTRTDALALVELLGRRDPEIRAGALERLERHGIDALLDDPRVASALITDPRVNVRPSVFFYVLLRQALLEGGLRDPGTADFVTSLVLAFASGRRAWRLSDESDEEFEYMVDLIQRLARDDGRDAFLIHAHTGNYALWLAGLFPDHLERRRRRRGAPPMRYYEDVGSAGYRSAAATSQARNLGVDVLLREVAGSFPAVRVALNRFGDRHLWRGGANPVGRLIREMEGRRN